MILAAGRGERMRPLTDTLPKPLLRAGGKALIEYHLQNLAQAGFHDIVINHAHLGQMIEAALGNGERFGIRIHYSPESAALETAGGIAQALPALRAGAGSGKRQPFLAVNADIYCSLDFSTLLPVLHRMRDQADSALAHLVLVDNPAHHPDGDFSLESGRVTITGKERLTFSGIGIYQPELFQDIVSGTVAKLAPLLKEAMAREKVSGQRYRGSWVDVGTPERLRLLDIDLMRPVS
ncbi:MAG: nucleotidyltransferase family protein [Nitrosospira multiformis]|nr:nucleotidyltransferase family protein [Nitrosospira multiformis]